jgi:hypothetical protein
MSSSPETLFRANSVGSKAFDMYMKMCGYSFLYDVVHPTVEQIYNEKKGLEVQKSPSVLHRLILNEFCLVLTCLYWLDRTIKT